MVHYPEMSAESRARYYESIELVDPYDREVDDAVSTVVQWQPTGRRVSGMRILSLLSKEILEEIVAALVVIGPNRHTLRLFSLTCKWIRELCKPHLFRTNRLSSESKILPGKIYHDTGDVWRHIQELTLYGSWDAKFLGPALKDQSVASVLANFLSRLSRLSTLKAIGSVKGIPSDVANMLLSIPSLSHLVLEVKRGCSHLILPRGAQLPAMTFTSFEYRVPRYSASPPSFNGESSILELILRQRSSFLVHLTIPGGIISSSTLASLPWPRLRELRIENHCDLGQGAPIDIDAILSETPFLRSLLALLPQGPKSRRLCLWPAQRDAPFPCQELENLTVSYPDPQDSAYSQLPATLRRLCLRCTPRHYVHRYRYEERTLIELGLQSPILKASEALSILRQCRSDGLQELELEYEEDERDMELLASIPAYFPALTALTLYRYRRRGSIIDACVTEIAQALASLAKLCILRLHLDFAAAPHPLACFMDPGTVRPGAWAAYRGTLTSTACTFAATVASLELVCMLLREKRTNEWLPFEVIREQPEGPSVKVNKFISIPGHLSMSDEDGPRTQAQYFTLEDRHLFEF